MWAFGAIGYVLIAPDGFAQLLISVGMAQEFVVGCTIFVFVPAVTLSAASYGVSADLGRLHWFWRAAASIICAEALIALELVYLSDVFGNVAGYLLSGLGFASVWLGLEVLASIGLFWIVSAFLPAVVVAFMIYAVLGIFRIASLALRLDA